MSAIKYMIGLVGLCAFFFQFVSAVRSTSHDHLFRKLHSQNHHHALEFRRITADLAKTNKMEVAAAKGIFDTACGTGQEIMIETGEILGPTCIEEVFEMTAQDKLPETTLAGLFIGETFFDMNSEPWTKRFAFVIAAAVGYIRQTIEPRFIEAFDTYYSKNIMSKAFRPTGSYTLRWKKYTLLYYFTKPIGFAIGDILGKPCDLLPTVGISFIGHVEFPLSKWCRYAVSYIVTEAMQFVDLFFEKAANHLAKKSREAVANNRTEGRNLRCFNFETVNNLLTRRVSEAFTHFHGDECDFFKVLPIVPPVKGKPDTNKPLFNEASLTDGESGQALKKMFEKCKKRTDFVSMMKSSEKIPDSPDKSLRKGSKDEEDGSPDAEKDSKFEIPATGTGVYDCAQVINSFMKAQLPPHIKNAEIVKYSLMTLIDHVFDYMEDAVKDAIKDFVSWVNTATGVTQQLDVGMCCAAAGSGATSKKSKCCGASRNACMGLMRDSSNYVQIKAIAIPVTVEKPIKEKHLGRNGGCYTAVTAKYKTKGDWERGSIEKVTGSGKSREYKIKYHHVFIGDTETKKAEDYVHTLIRRVGKAGIDWKIGTSWKVGTRVESRYRGPGKDFYKGKITAIHGNPKMPLHQSYDILYDDKDTIKRQPRYAHTLMEEVMCEGDPNPPGKGEPMWIVGTKVTANFKGKGSWYNGVISAAHADGTYDILYDDGDLEKNKAPYDYGCVWHGIRKSDAKFKDITEGYPSVEKKAEWKKAGKKRPPKSIQCPKTVQHPKKGRIETEDICAKITDYWQIHAPLQCKVSK